MAAGAEQQDESLIVDAAHLEGGASGRRVEGVAVVEVAADSLLDPTHTPRSYPPHTETRRSKRRKPGAVEFVHLSWPLGYGLGMKIAVRAEFDTWEVGPSDPKCAQTSLAVNGPRPVTAKPRVAAIWPHSPTIPALVQICRW